jgi:uncharacterized protein YndB with AHSA1/START domain
MATIYHQIGIKGSLKSIYEALSTIEGLSKWWTSDTRGDCSVGGAIEYYFNDIRMDMKVLDPKENELVRWRCAAGDSQWMDTEITFKLRERDK